MFDFVFQKLQRVVAYIYNKYLTPKPPNLIGDRDIENAFIASNLPSKKGKAMDFGSGRTNLSLMAALRGFKVKAVDLLPNRFTYKHENIQFINGDFLNYKFINNSLDLIINCSSIEHVGLQGRYGVTKQVDYGDISAMNNLYKLLKRGGIMLLTIPVGVDSVVGTLHRIYGKKRLPKLLFKYNIVKEIYWTKNYNNKWIITSKQRALSTKASNHFYNIGCYVLSK